MFRAFSRPSSGAKWLQWQPMVLPSYRGDSRVVFVVGPAGRPARPRKQHDCHHDTKVKPEAATAVIELLRMGGKTPETCWAVNKRQDNKLKNCCIWLVIYLNCTIMHGLTNLKPKIGRHYIWLIQNHIQDWSLALRPGSDTGLHKCESRFVSYVLLRGPETTNFVLYPQDRGVFTEGMYVIAHSRAPSHSLRSGLRNNYISGRSIVKYP